MPMLYITCPITKKPTPTLIDMPKGTNPNNLRNNSLVCQHCSQKHNWDGKDAFFEDGSRLSENLK